MPRLWEVLGQCGRARCSTGCVMLRSACLVGCATWLQKGWKKIGWQVRSDFADEVLELRIKLDPGSARDGPLKVQR